MFWYILGLIVVLIIQIAIASKFSSIAEDKGYDGSPYFWACVFLGVIGYCMVAALPDLTLYRKINNLTNPGSTTNKSASPGSTISKSASPGSTISKSVTGSKTWTCKNCNTENSAVFASCQTCGKYRS